MAIGVEGANELVEGRVRGPAVGILDLAVSATCGSAHAFW
jgi:hypothetical protein